VLLPSHRWVRWEIATSGDINHWAGIPGFLQEPTFADKQCSSCGRRKNYVPCWDKECETVYRSFTRALVGTDSDRATSSLLSQVGQKTHEHWEETVNSIDFSHSSCKAWWTINKLTSRSGRSFRQCPILANREERSTQDQRSQVHQAGQQGAVQPMENSNTWGSQYLWTLYTIGACCCPQMPEAKKVSRIGIHLPGVHTSRPVGPQILVLWLPHFLYAPTQNSKDLEKSTNCCDP